MIKETFCSPEYHVDEYGNVYGKKGRILKPSINPRGYRMVNFIINGKRKGFSVHTLVARAFCDGYRKGLIVNHIDGNKLNNYYKNLEWVTYKENSIHATKVLGVNVGARNGSAKTTYAYDKNTLEFKYKFDTLSDAARFFAGDSYKRFKHIKTLIWKVVYHIDGRKSYRGMIWTYEPIEQNSG